jgi:hypothetical protein
MDKAIREILKAVDSFKTTPAGETTYIHTIDVVKTLAITLSDSIININVPYREVQISGKLSESALGIGRRSGISYAHWLRDNSSTILRDSLEEPESEFADRLRNILTVALTLLDMSLDRFFLDKNIIIYSRDDDCELEIYASSGYCLLKVETSSEKIVKQIEVTEGLMKKLKDPDAAQEKAKTLAKDIIAEEKTKMAVYGDSQEAFADPVILDEDEERELEDEEEDEV